MIDASRARTASEDRATVTNYNRVANVRSQFGSASDRQIHFGLRPLGAVADEFCKTLELDVGGRFVAGFMGRGASPHDPRPTLGG